jgi:hypothetical protein
MSLYGPGFFLRLQCGFLTGLKDDCCPTRLKLSDALLSVPPQHALSSAPFATTATLRIATTSAASDAAVSTLLLS